MGCLNINKILIVAAVFAAGVGNASSFAEKTVKVRAGALLLKNEETLEGYAKTRGKIEVSYLNKLLGADAKVYLRFFYTGRSHKNNEMCFDYRTPVRKIPMARQSKGSWLATSEQILHELGSQTKLTEVNFDFEVIYPGSKPVVDSCDDKNNRYYFYFEDFSEYDWQESDNHVIKLKAAELDCDRGTVVVHPICSKNP